jgi:purine catabolism regulator
VAAVAATSPLRSAAGVRRSAQLGVRGLLWWQRSDPRLQAFTEAQLGRLLAHQGPRGEDLIGVLRAYLAAGGNVSGTATALHLSRPAAYARLDRLVGLLGADLSDPEVRLSVHVALLAHDQSQLTGSH